MIKGIKHIRVTWLRRLCPHSRFSHMIFDLSCGEINVVMSRISTLMTPESRLIKIHAGFFPRIPTRLHRHVHADFFGGDLWAH